MLKKVRSWSKPNIANIIGRKRVDWSLFTYGIHIPLEFSEEFKQANGGVHLAIGDSHNVELIINDRTFNVMLYNTERNNQSIDTLQIHYDSNKELKNYLQECFKTSYDYILQERAAEAESSDKKHVIVPDSIAEYMDLYRTETPFKYRVEIIASNSAKDIHHKTDQQNSLAYPFDKIFANYAEAIWAFNLMAKTAENLGITSGDDERLSVTLQQNTGVLRFDFCNWLVVGFNAKAKSSLTMHLALLENLAGNYSNYNVDKFAQKDNEPQICLYLLPLEQAKLILEMSDLYDQTLHHIAQRFLRYSRSPFRRSNVEQLASAIFDTGKRFELLEGGLSKHEIDAATPNLWWVNQGDSLETEKNGGYLWAALKGRKGRTVDHWETMAEVQKGDIILHYANGALRYISKVTQSAVEAPNPTSQKKRELEKQGRLIYTDYYKINPEVPLNHFAQQLLSLDIDKGPLDKNGNAKQGYLFRLSKAVLNLKIPIAQLKILLPEFADPELSPDNLAVNDVDFSINPAYTIADLASETSLGEEEMQRWVKAIKRKGQAILYGPPGTGKTYVAERLAKHLIAEDNGFCDLVQFHPAYAYEDFIQGIRPVSKPDGGLEYPVVPGRFLEFCKEASKRNGNCVLIIDEINRANLSRVFGELMYLLEYRDREIPLAGGGNFKIPANVYIIGTMNTADRSIAMVDHALRRRFAFLALYPNYQVLSNFHSETGFSVDGLIEILKRINKQIADRHYELGISFFMHYDLDDQLEDIWIMEIEPYLEEYFLDQPDKIANFRWHKIKDIVQP